MRYSYMEVQKNQIMFFFNLFTRLLQITIKWCLRFVVMERCVSSRTDKGAMNQTKTADQKKRNAVQICKAGSSDFTNE